MNKTATSGTFGPGEVALLYAGIAALWIIASGALLSYSVQDPVLQTRIELAKGLGFVAVTAALLYALLARWRRSLTQASVEPRLAAPAPGLQRIILLFAALALVVPLIGAVIVAVHGPQSERQTYNDLQAIAELKAEQIENWMAEREADAAALGADEALAAQIYRFVRAERGAAFPAEASDRLDRMRREYGYDSILILDPNGRLLHALGGHADLPPDVRHLLTESVAAVHVRRSDLYRDAGGQAYIDWIVPVVETAAAGKRVVAVIVLRVAAGKFLFPLIQRWPGSSLTAETLLASREGDSVLFLNALRHHQNGVPSERLSLSEQSLPAAVALRAAKPGVVQGNDYRGVPVLAAYRPVQRTGWHIVAKIDRAEALAPLRELVLWVSALAVLAFLAIGVALLGLWRQQQRTQALALLAQTTRTDRLLQQFFDLPFIGMAMTSPASKYWLRFNDRLCEILGYTREELAGKTWTEITHPDDLNIDVAEFERVMRGETEGYAMDKRYLRPDGTVVHATIDVKAVRAADGTVDYFVATIQDISERKRAEQQLQRQRNLYAALSDANHAIVHAHSREALFHDICKVTVERAGFRFAWVGMVDPDANTLRPVGRFGEDRGYLDAIRVAVDAGDAEGAGPGGRVVQLGVHQIVNDIDADSAMAPWRAQAAKAGIRALAAFPVRVAGVVAGAMSVYAAQADTFDAAAVALLDEMASDLSFALDNLERERARGVAVAELERAEARWHFALEGADHGVWEWNAQTNRVFYSQRWKAILGYGDADIGDGFVEWESRVHPDELGPAWNQLQRHFAGETPIYVSEHRMRCKDGGYKWLQARGKVISRDNSGQPLMVVGTVTDISERRKSEENLRASEERFRRAVEEAPFPILIHAEDGTVVSLSRAWSDLSGYTVEDIPTIADWLERAYGTRRSMVQAEIDTHYNLSGRKDEGEYRVRCKDGTDRIWIFSSVSLGRQPDGRRIAMSMAADVTQRKQIERSLALRDAVLSAVSRSTQQFLAPTLAWRSAVDEVLAGVGAATEMSRVYLFENVQGAGATLVSRQTHEWVAPGVGSFLHDQELQAFSWDDYGVSALAQTLERGDPVFAHRRQLPDPFARLLAAEDVQSIALVPIMVERRCWGFIGFDQCHEERESSATEREVLSVVAATLAAAIQQEAARTELVESEARFRGLVEQSLVGIFMIDEERVIYSNPRAAEILGYVPADIEGKPYRDFIADMDWPAAEREVQRVLSGEAQFGKLDLTARHREGHDVIVGAQGIRTRREGRVVALCVMQDISEKKIAEEQIRRYVEQLEAAFMSTVKVATTLSEMRDPYTAGHERRVAEIAVALGAELGLDERQQEGLSVAGHLHDVGKITIPAEILAKPGKLTAIEFELIKSHPQSGYDVLKEVEFPWPVAQVALQHHERIDGSGYPQGLKGDAILLEARIMAVADVVEAMATHRPYRPGLGIDAALAEIERGRGTAYDAEVADACLKLFREKGYTIPT